MPRLVDQLLSLGNVNPMGGRSVFLFSWVLHIKSVGLTDKHADTPIGSKPLDLEPSFGRHHGASTVVHIKGFRVWTVWLDQRGQPVGWLWLLRYSSNRNNSGCLGLPWWSGG